MMSALSSMHHYEKTKLDLTRKVLSFSGFLLGVLLAAWVCFANAAMTGYQFDNRCIPTQAEVLEAFKFKSQYLQSGSDYEVCGGAHSPIITANLSYTSSSAPTAIKYYVISAAVPSETCTTSSPKYLGIPLCDPDVQSLAFTGTNALFLVLGFFYAGMLGFKTGYRA